MQYSFDASQVDPTQGVEIWPDNTWVKVIAESHKPVPLASDDKAGRLLWTLRCVEGPLQGKLQFLGMNLWHGDESVRKRAEGELSALTWVTLGATKGTLQFGDFTELQNIPFFIMSTHQAPDKAGGSPRQNFRGFKDVNGNDPGKQAGGGAPAQQPAFGGAPGGFPQQAPAQQAPVGFAPGGFGQQPPAQQPAPAAAPFGAPQQQMQFAPPPAQSAPPAFGAPAAAPAAAPFGAPAQQFAPPPAQQAPGNFAPPGQPAGAMPWQR